MAGTSGDPLPLTTVAKKSLGIVVGLGGLCCALTVLYRSSNAVMAIGGSCASGGPFEIARPCPKGIAGMLPLSITGGLMACGIYTFSLFRVGPRLIAFAWSALFISLGWAFLRNGFDPIQGGTAPGFLVCGFLFIAMGGLPLWWLLRPSILSTLLLGGSSVAPAPARAPSALAKVWDLAVTVPGTRTQKPPLAPVDDDVVSGLEPVRVWATFLHVAAIVGGIVAGSWIFDTFSR